MASRAEIRLAVVSLCHKHGEPVENVLAKSTLLEAWIYREDKAECATVPLSASGGDQSPESAPADEAGQATPSVSKNHSKRS